jgi:arabinogalactan endo-1,4-beta-galactosidase
MTALERQQHERLSEIGRELNDAYSSGHLDFEAFKALLTRAITAVGADHPDLEMFCHYATGEGWFAWMVQELQKTPSRRVA